MAAMGSQQAAAVAGASGLEAAVSAISEHSAEPKLVMACLILIALVCSSSARLAVRTARRHGSRSGPDVHRLLTDVDAARW